MSFPQPVDILILTNGPGEVTTWVRPVVKALRSLLGDNRDQVRISVVLSPCPNASGQEAAILQSYSEVDRVQAARHFYSFLLRGKTAAEWDWRDRGVILFLGGDQFFSVLIGRHLGYRTVVYSEWQVRWLRWIDRFGIMHSQTLKPVPLKYIHKLTVVGDLMAEARSLNPGGPQMITQALDLQPQTELIGLLPGSKPAKLMQGVPLAMAIAEQIQRSRPQTRFVIPVAPTLDLATLAEYADPLQNPVLETISGVSAKLFTQPRPYLKTTQGVRIDLWTQAPAYELLSECCLCLTTVGANTAELGALTIPMLVLLPTQQLDAMRSWDGALGLLANLPGIGSRIAKLINWLALQRLGLLAWPNIWAGREIVPELVGQLHPQAVAEQVLDLLSYPEKLARMRQQLRNVRGEPGAAQNLAVLVKAELER